MDVDRGNKKLRGRRRPSATIAVALAFGIAPVYAEAATAFVACGAGRSGAKLVAKGGALRQARTRKPGGAGRLVMQQSAGKGGFPPLPSNYPPKRNTDYPLEEGQIGVRFINSSGDPDVVVGAYPGEKVTHVAKRAGITIPTACATGICGTCTTDLEDKNGKGYRPGFQIVKACVTKVTLVPGAEEMVLDVYRNRSSKGKLNRHLMAQQQGQGRGQGQDWERPDADMPIQTLGEAMSRFAEGWEDGYKAPDESKPKTTLRKGSASRGRTRIERLVRPTLTERQQRILSNQNARNELPEGYAEDGYDPYTGRSLVDNDNAAYQETLKRRRSEMKREAVNYYLDNAARPIASVEDLLTLTEEERESRSRYFRGTPVSAKQSYGPWTGTTPEEEREETEYNFREFEGVCIGRSAAYRAAYQVPRYRFWGDPPLEETDAEYMRTREVREEISEDDMTEVEFRESVKESDRKEKLRHIYRDARTGREVLLQDAAKPWTVKGERRQTYLHECSHCHGYGKVPCSSCRGTGLDAAMDANGAPYLCSRCRGEQEMTCGRCMGMGVPEFT